ncbi:type II toxin-antitoxin system VapC family toxin [Pseudomonas jinjuensis]|uniref:PIN domain nuclease, a component of toxin-antitoxin system (PIN domain) n=1 Tax=Pseudomonas jinjuensis TaxID=198616 RepID=A0A1H0AUX7_9PSED|nr:type II toxin-antitoxin system VapC family toxin [Pseudomonas jinjuensis]SDN37155.1 PIN domain nuclease, a component of toxin-antitoxin system (PIN domain) [Pseudomonas jinjuensis]
MRLLLDTHILLWLAGNDPRLPKTVLQLVEDTRNTLVFSAASMWEIAVKRSRGRPDFPHDAPVIRQALLDAGYQELAIDSHHAMASTELPKIHGDPFDRILIAQAQLGGMVLVTADQTVARYPGAIKLV